MTQQLSNMNEKWHLVGISANFGEFEWKLVSLAF